MRILILNQYSPEQDAPTGRLFGELALDWGAAGHECELVSAGAGYRHRSGFRLWRELCALGAVFWKGLAAGRSDVVVAGSSPPCLLAVAALVAGWHRSILVHWALDLYPELGVSLGERGAKACAGFLSRVMRKAYARCQAVLTLDGDMVAVLERYGVSARQIRPWVSGAPGSRSGADNGLMSAGAAARPFRWVYSGNLGRAHEWRTLLDAQALLEARGVEAELVFQGGGGGRKPAQEYARVLGLKRCHWLPYVSEDKLVESLLGHDCLVATQLPWTCGYLWPSKLALFLGLPRPVLWVGPQDGEIARLVRSKEGTGSYPVGDAQGVALWVERRRELGCCVAPLWDLEEEKRARLADWRRVLEQVQGGSL